ncbi:MAG: adenylate/guanylate cyclase domain-containing protein [Chloroflexota bacterium]
MQLSIPAVPRHLARKILAERGALEGERKQVTVLFCDLVNSTPLTARLGAEAMHALVNELVVLASGEVHRYEGTVNQFLGDGFMALFGAPLAHEDHARRAALAALAINRRLHEGLDTPGRTLGVQLSVRMGLHTGLVVVGGIGDDLHMEYTAIGDTVNVAKRFQEAARPDQIVISEATHRLVAGYCTTEPLGLLALKGKDDPLPGWALTDVSEARTRLEVEVARGLSLFVGRQHELGILVDCFTRAQNGHGQVVFLVGEAGLGKSRLLLELRQHLGGAATWLEGHSLAFGHAMAFHPIVDLVRRYAGITERDAEEHVIAKIERVVLALGADLKSIGPYLRVLLGIDAGEAAVRTMDPQLRRSETFDALRRLLLRLADERPLVLVVEDLHWIDQATEALLGFVAESIPTSRVLCVLTCRPGYTQPFGDHSYHTRVTVPSLAPVETVQLAGGMLATEHLPEALERLIVRKAEGNPFFVEEVIRSLRETGAITSDGERAVVTGPLDAIAVPDTVQDVLMARIDRLPAGSRATLQLASAIGREVPHRLLRQLTDAPDQLDAAIRDLRTTELIYPQRAFPEVTYTFKHALTQEVAYASLLAQRRLVLHASIGEAVELVYADRLADQYEILGYHYSRAEAWAKALEYLVKAAERAAGAFAIREALTLYEQAEEAAGRLGEETVGDTRIGIHRAKAELYLLSSDFERARSESDRARALARRLGDRAAEGDALVSMGLAAFWGHAFDQALQDASQALAIAEAIGSPSIQAGGHLTTGLVYEVTGRLEPARDQLEQAITISRSVGDVANESSALVFAAELRGWEGKFDEAVALYTRAIPLAREHDVLMPVLEGHFMCGIALTSKGEYDRARAMFEEGLALVEKVGDENFRPRYLNSLGWLHVECGDLERGFELNQRAAAGARERGDHESIANADLNLGDICLARGDLASARELFEGVQQLVRSPITSDWMRWRYSMHMFASLGDLWLARGDPTKAVELAHRCLETATRTQSRKYLVRSWRLLGEIAQARQAWEEAEQWLDRALPLARQVGNPPQLARVHLASGRLYAATRRPEQADTSFRAVRETIERVMGGIHDARLQSGLGQSPLMQEAVASIRRR